MDIAALISLIRRNGWQVAVHNDYRLDGKSWTFWLFTKLKGVPCENGDGLYVKGEGNTDSDALFEVARKLKLL